MKKKVTFELPPEAITVENLERVRARNNSYHRSMSAPTDPVDATINLIYLHQKYGPGTALYPRP